MLLWWQREGAIFGLHSRELIWQEKKLWGETLRTTSQLRHDIPVGTQHGHPNCDATWTSQLRHEYKHWTLAFPAIKKVTVCLSYEIMIGNCTIFEKRKLTYGSISILTTYLKIGFKSIINLVTLALLQEQWNNNENENQFIQIITLITSQPTSSQNGTHEEIWQWIWE